MPCHQKFFRTRAVGPGRNDVSSCELGHLNTITELTFSVIVSQCRATDITGTQGCHPPGWHTHTHMSWHHYTWHQVTLVLWNVWKRGLKQHSQWMEAMIGKKNWEVRASDLSETAWLGASDLSETERSDTQFFCSLFPASELASRPCHSWLDPNNCIHTTEGAVTTNGTNVITYKRNTLHYIRCYERSLLQKERLLQKDQCHNLQKVLLVLQKVTPEVCHHLPVCRIWRRHGDLRGSHSSTFPLVTGKSSGGEPPWYPVFHNPGIGVPNQWHEFAPRGTPTPGLWHTGYQGGSPPELLPITRGKLLEWEPLRSHKLSAICCISDLMGDLLMQLSW